MLKSRGTIYAMQTTAVCSSLVWWWILLVTCPGLPSGRPDDSPLHDPPTDQDEDVLASTVSGSLRGRTERVTDSRTQVYMFLGVPYARPPLGELRFHAPLPHPPWTGVRNATQHGAHCVQDIPKGQRFYHSIPLFMPHDRISEDCLFLDVYTPTMDASARLAVLFFIHGGGLFSGGGAQYDGRALAAMGNIVVVIINYRLGVLGFSGIGGQWNVGFLDQISALRWVQHNIHAFGGDPGRVTIAGQSAGGLSVGLLVLSPLTDGLFRRAISQSGAATTLPTNMNRDQTVNRFVLLSGMCRHLSPPETLECLRNASIEDFVKVRPLTAWNQPVVDGSFLPDQPRTLLKNGPAKNIEYLMGVTNHELGHIVAQDSSWHFNTFEKDRDQMRTTISLGYGNYFQCFKWGVDLKKFISDPLLDLYMAEQDPLMQVLGDIIMTAPTVNTARYRTDTPVYLYEFQHRPSWHHGKPGHVKADHGDELLFVFGAPFFDWPRDPADPAWRVNFTEGERVLSRKILTYWTNFVKTGDPNRGDTEPTSTFDLETWPSYSHEDQEYLQLDLDMSTDHRLKEEKVKRINDMLMCSNSSASSSGLDRTWTITTLCLLMLFLYYDGFL
ncbi:fatty acyl-CoA hydrolase precursor, medium chain-like [Branchiostoma floridae]|uniref:Carboxylic ester hydrolase n=1 Tax=Branchiostoma floridae TaxID=7739 RepID=A0A9J7LHH5_BRAFL|nr:fatty acyl-CoA hydrolase precursor, medium chain-like [Branchiostoma floridae]XP_035681805.1 fatty acyl-CoA hydrolase precursor, medium chain-like [Branchiostoma floridae]